MNILFVATSFPTDEKDGTSRFLLNRVLDLMGLGHKVTVLVPAGPGRTPGETIVSGVTVHRFYYPLWKNTGLVYGAGMAENLKLTRNRIRLAGFLPWLVGAVRREAQGFDIVDAQWMGTAAAVVAADRGFFYRKFRLDTGSGRKRRFPVVATAHRLSDDFFWKRLNRFVFKRADFIIFCSRFLAEKAESIGGFEGWDVVYPAITVEGNSDFRSDEGVLSGFHGSTVVTALGRLIEKKGFEYYVRAAASVLEKRKAVFLLGGDGPERRKLELLVEKFGIKDDFHFMGRLSPNQVRELYHRTDIFVMPSVRDAAGEEETFGTVLAEAMASRLPVIGFASGAIPELLGNGSCGVIVGERDWRGLAREIVFLLDNPEARAGFGERAAKTIRSEFDPLSQAKKLTRIYTAVIDRWKREMSESG